MDLLTSVGYALAYAVVGIVVLGVGYGVLDLLTPGHLGRHIMAGSMNAALVAASGILGLGLVVYTAIWHHADASVGEALGYTIVFGLFGVVVQAVAFRLVDIVMPDDLAATAMETTFHPATLVPAATQIAVSLVVVASIA